MGSLTFQFSGICTHFRFGVAAGVPHRVVLPEASNFLTGFLTATDPITPVTPGPPVLYYITPHFPQLDLTSASAPVFGVPDPDLSSVLTIDGLIEDGDIRSGIRVQVANATDTQMSYAGGIPTLTTFMPDYNFSNDVVLNGRAACYIDIYGGSQTTVPADSQKPQIVLIKVQTEGPPALLVSSLLTSAVTRTPGKSFLIPLTKKDEDLTLIVKNLEADPQEEPAEEDFGAYDYLLHYLTARGGIPQTIQATAEGNLLPGMPNPLSNANPKAIGNALIQLGKVLDPGGATDNTRKRQRLRLIGQMDTTPACSDSAYP